MIERILLIGTGEENQIHIYRHTWLREINGERGKAKKDKKKECDFSEKSFFVTSFSLFTSFEQEEPRSEA